MKKLLLITTMFLCVFSLHGCIPAWDALQDDRAIDTQSSDSSICKIITNRIMSRNFSTGWDVDVYCYYGYVFLVGVADEEGRKFAENTAYRDRRVRKVFTHWFEPVPGAEKDMTLRTRIRSALIETKGINSRKIETRVNSGNVVLLGIVSDETERTIAVRTTCDTPGVREVTSFLMLPQKVGNPLGPQNQTFPGISQNDEYAPPVDTTRLEQKPSPVEPPMNTEGRDID